MRLRGGWVWSTQGSGEPQILFFVFFVFNFFLAMLGLCCCALAFSSSITWGLLSSHVLRLLISVASLVVKNGLWSVGSVVVVHGLSCPVACGISPDQGLNLCYLHWQADSYPLGHQDSPQFPLLQNATGLSYKFLNGASV